MPGNPLPGSGKSLAKFMEFEHEVRAAGCWPRRAGPWKR